MPANSRWDLIRRLRVNLQNAGRLVNCLLVHCTERSVSITVSRSSACGVPAIFVQNRNVATHFSENLTHELQRKSARHKSLSSNPTDTHDEASSPYSHSALRTRLKWNNLDAKLNVNACRLIYIHFRSRKPRPCANPASCTAIHSQLIVYVTSRP